MLSSASRTSAVGQLNLYSTENPFALSTLSARTGFWLQTFLAFPSHQHKHILSLTMHTAGWQLMNTARMHAAATPPTSMLPVPWWLLLLLLLLLCCSDMLGTVSDYSLRQGHSSVTIVRSSAPKAAAGSHQYMLATDGSKAAALAFCTLCHQ